MSQTTRYAAVLAKTDAEKGKLLSETKIKSLIESKNLGAFVSQLRDTSYQMQLAKVPLLLNSRKLERAFNENLIEAYIKMVKNSPQKAADFLAVYILRFEVENLKALIKATNGELSTEEKLSRIYFSAEDSLGRRVIFEEAAKASNLKQMSNSIKSTVYASALSRSMAGYDENRSTSGIDVLVDKVFYDKLRDAYEELPRAEKPHAFFYAAMENDGFTLLTILRGKNLKYDASWLKAAIPTKNFKLTSETVEALLMASDFESALKIASETFYGKFFTKMQNPEDSLAAAEKSFRKAIFQNAKAATIGEIFNIGAPLAFMMLKEAEVRNLIGVSAGIETGVNAEYIQSQMLL